MVNESSCEIAEHINKATQYNREVKSMMLNWKVSKKDQLDFNYCTFLSLKTYNKASPKKTEAVDVHFGLRQDIDFIYDLNIRKQTMKFKNLMCLSCGKKTIPDKMIKIKNEWVFDYYNLRKENQKEEDNYERTDELENNSIFLSPNIADSLITNYFLPEHKIPLHFRRKYKLNRFNKEKDFLFSNDPQFKRLKDTFVCLDCYLLLAKHFQNKLGSPSPASQPKNPDGEARLESRMSKLKLVLRDRKNLKKERKAMSRASILSSPKNELKKEFKSSSFSMKALQMNPVRYYLSRHKPTSKRSSITTKHSLSHSRQKSIINPKTSSFCGRKKKGLIKKQEGLDVVDYVKKNNFFKVKAI